MKTSPILLIVWALFAETTAGAQDTICATPPLGMEAQFQTKSEFEASAMSQLTINVVFHIINNSVTLSHTDDMLATLNNSFSPASIQFVKLCVNAASSRSSTNDLPYAINVYIDPGVTTPYARKIGANALYLPPRLSNSESLTHEMGHCLYLLHTHDAFACFELVNGSNCSTCGDLVCDTPADPLLSGANKVDANCNYIGTAVDANGDPYHPDTHNWMSYALNCRNRFSAGQIERMRTALQTLPELQAVSSRPQIQGPNAVCTSGTYSQTYPPNTAVTTWSVTPSNLVTPSTGNGSPANVTQVGNGNATIVFKNGCYTLNSFSFRVGLYTPTEYPINGPSSAVCKQDVVYSGPALAYATNYQWTWPGSWSYISGQGTQNLRLRTPSGVCQSCNIILRVENACGLGIGNRKATRVTCLSGFAVYPNPVSEELTVSFNEDDGLMNPYVYLDTYTVNIYDSKSNLIYSSTSNQDKIAISTRSYPQGKYILNIVQNGEIVQTQIFISK